MTIQTALRQGTELLEKASIPVPRLTAEVLLAHAVACERSWLYAHPEHELREVEWLHFGRYLHQRLEGMPTQYITRRQEFFGREFHVTPDVLIPRPETEHVIEEVLREPAHRILDAGTGSGAIAITLERETGAQVWASDISQRALAVAWENARRLSARVQFVACDLASAFAPRSFDTVASNPPYVPLDDLPHLQREVRDFEPYVALIGGPTGFEIYERLVAQAERVLRPGGRLVMELGYNSGQRVSGMFGSRWEQPRLAADLAGIPRVVTCRLQP
ncbi:MAG: peptide chain release factor N(5)-glutamine methyltransferase [Bryobacteraceae bacterium]